MPFFEFKSDFNEQGIQVNNDLSINLDTTRSVLRLSIKNMTHKVRGSTLTGKPLFQSKILAHSKRMDKYKLVIRHL